jgi:hypothetical protein
MCCALLRRERCATTVRYSFRAAAVGLATLAIEGMTQLGLLRAAAAKLRTRLAQHDPELLFAAPDHVDLPTGEHVPLRDGRTEHGFLPEDAWKERYYVRARLAGLERNGGPRVPRGRKGKSRPGSC